MDGENAACAFRTDPSIQIGGDEGGVPIVGVDCVRSLIKPFALQQRPSGGIQPLQDVGIIAALFSV